MQGAAFWKLTEHPFRKYKHSSVLEGNNYDHMHKKMRKR